MANTRFDWTAEEIAREALSNPDYYCFSGETCGVCGTKANVPATPRADWKCPQCHCNNPQEYNEPLVLFTKPDYGPEATVVWRGHAMAGPEGFHDHSR